ncbi:MAG: enolase C-terminal domain-like protein [Actinomycetota bacterium]
MELTAIDVYLVDLPLTEPFVASHGTTTSRTLSLLRVTTDAGIGWGECSALPAATYTAESAVGSYRALADRIGPALIGLQVPTEDVGPPGFDALQELPMARSCVEMALLDARLTAAGTPLAAWLSNRVDTSRPGTSEPPLEVIPTTIPAGVSVGLASIAETVETCAALAAEGYRRLKVKIQPGHDVRLVEQLIARLPDIELHVDANGAYPPGSEPLLDLVSAGAAVIEQPFAASEASAAAELIARLEAEGRSVTVVADEAVTRHDDAVRLLSARAMTGLSIKPGRVGGILPALALHDLCRSAGIAATAGGMLETGLGRHALVALAALPGFTLTGDLSPAGRWLAADPWPDLSLTDGHIMVPTQPGVCGDPDPELLAAHTVEHTSLGG